jgi:lysophospholipase L1-like esterase
MTDLPTARLGDFLDGHVGLLPRGASVQPLRMPVAERHLHDRFTRWVAAIPSGVRLRLRTDSRSLHLWTRQRQTWAADRPEWPSVYDLFIDGALVRRVSAAGGARRIPLGEVLGDDRARLALDDLPAGDKRIELWFPTAATVAIERVALDDDAAVAPWPDERPRIVFHGSSNTQCASAPGGSESWPAIACAMAGARLLNLGWAGSCLLSASAARVVRDEPAAAIVLELGVNVWSEGLLKERTFRDSAHAMIALVRERHRHTPMAVVSPFLLQAGEDRGDRQGLSARDMRALLAEVVALHRHAGDDALRHVDGLSLFGPGDAALQPDGVHPDAAGYRLIAERFHAAMLAPGRLMAAAMGR